MTDIVDITAREILDSRGNPTVEVDVTLEDGSFGRAAVPSGASTGAHEAVERRDGDPAATAARACCRRSTRSTARSSTPCRASTPRTSAGIDAVMIELDGTPNKSRLGANAILGVSLGAAKAAAHRPRLPLYHYVGGVAARVLPVPQMNIINGGAHADNPIDIQEFMILPTGARHLRRGPAHGRGDLPQPEDRAARRPAITPTSATRAASPRTWPRPTRRWSFILKAGEAAGYKAGKDFHLGLDVAATEFFKDGRYDMTGEGKTLDQAGMVDYLAGLVAKLPDRLDRGRLRRGRFRGLEDCSPSGWATRSSSSATTCS